MKKLLLSLSVLLLSIALTAQTYCATSAIGYGAAATGGGSASPTLVKTTSELSSALTASGSKVIIVTQNITFTSCMKVKATNKTLLALPGVKLISAQQNKDNSGILYFKSGSSNIILRNLTFEGPGAYDCDGWDLLCFDGVTKAWVDHCDFQDGCDGNFDNKGTTDNVTVSWCRFRYLKSPKAGGPGGSDDHRFTNLLGSSSSDKPSDGTYSMTWAYCWWDNGCKERMLRCRNASLHFLNCYWNSSVANYYVGPENADCRFDGCSFQGAPAKTKYFYQNYSGKNGATFTNCIAKNGVPANVTNRTVASVPYTYTTLTAANAVTAITSSCGAGATLTVTSAGDVSSSCDGGNTNPPAETYTITYNMNGHGTAIAQVTEATALPNPLPTPTATGWTFGGWYTNSSLTTKAVAGATITANTTLYAKWTENTSGGETGGTSNAIYSLTNSIGSAEVTAETAVVTAGTSLVLSNTSGRIKLTPKSGEVFKNGDKISFSGSIGNTAKNYGIKIFAADGSTNAGQIYVAGTIDPLAAEGTLTLSADANCIFIGRYDGTTTTLTSCEITRAGSGSGTTDPDPVTPTDPDPVDPQPTDNVTWWNLSDSDFPTGTVSSNTTVRNLTIAADGATTWTVENNSKSADGYSFTQRYKSGGAGSAAGRHFAFHVSGACTITVYALSSSTSAARVLNIVAGSAFSTTATGTIDIPATSTLASYSYNYTGGENNIYIASAGGGINFYGIKVQGATVTDATESETEITEEDPDINDPANKSQTVIRGNAITDIVFTASGTATSISVSGLPAGLTGTKNGLVLTISGTPTAEGAYTITVKNASGGTSYEGGYITIEEPAEPTPSVTTDIVQQSTWWNISDDDFKSLGTLSTETVVRQLHIVAGTDEKITIDSNSKTCDGISFTNRLKFGGEGSETRQVWFDVKGNCTIDVYLMSSNSTNARTLNVCLGDFGNTAVATLPAGTSLSKQTYEYDGSATTVRLYPADGGINVYGIRLTYPESGTVTALSDTEASTTVRKIFLNGKLYIERQGHTYTADGQLVK